MEENGQILVIGAGPAGLAVSRCLSELKINYEVVDRYGKAGGAYLRMYPRMVLSSPPSYLALTGSLAPSSARYLTVAEYVPYLMRYAEENGIAPIKREVVRIQPFNGAFDVSFQESSTPKRYAAIVVCTGNFDKPYIPTIPGLNDSPTIQSNGVSFIHACQWKGPPCNKKDRVLIVGGGVTAVELAEECIKDGINLTMSFRKGRGKTFPPKVLGLDVRKAVYPLRHILPISLFSRECNKGWSYRGVDRGFEEYRKKGLIDFRPLVEHVRSKTVSFIDGTSTTVDFVVFATGYRWDMPFLPKSIPRYERGHPVLQQGECVGMPGIFCVGIPCGFSVNSHFVHGTAEDAKCIAETIKKRFVGESTAVKHGRVTGIFIARSHELPSSVASVQAHAGGGLVGDRFGGHQACFKIENQDRGLTLIESEAIEAMKRELRVELSEAETRRNLVTRGISLNDLIGKKLFIGQVLIEGKRLCNPCGHLEKLTGKPVLKGLASRGGLRASILSDGVIKVGDEIRVKD